MEKPLQLVIITLHIDVTRRALARFEPGTLKSSSAIPHDFLYVSGSSHSYFTDFVNVFEAYGATIEFIAESHLLEGYANRDKGPLINSVARCGV